MIHANSRILVIINVIISCLAAVQLRSVGIHCLWSGCGVDCKIATRKLQTGPCLTAYSTQLNEHLKHLNVHIYLVRAGLKCKSAKCGSAKVIRPKMQNFENAKVCVKVSLNCEIMKVRKSA